MRENLLKKGVAIVLIGLIVSTVFAFKPITVHATMADEAQMYELGEEYRGRTVSNKAEYYKFSVSEKCRLNIVFSHLEGDNATIELYDATGNIVVYSNDVIRTTDPITEEVTAEVARFVNAGTYYLSLYRYQGGFSFAFTIQTEDKIKLSKGAISSLKSSATKKAIVTCKSDSNAIGYRIKYSTDPTFKSKVKTVYSPDETYTATGLTSKKTYYFKISPYNVYDDGTYVYGKTSAIKKVKVK